MFQPINSDMQAKIVLREKLALQRRHEQVYQAVVVVSCS
jgi:hypothetical protein